MAAIVDYPWLLLLPISLVSLFLAARLGRAVRRNDAAAEHREDFSVIQAATLTLLGLLIGFTFSMALGRYDQRKNFEEEEANALGTAYLRAELLPAAATAKLKSLLREYTAERVRFYTERDSLVNPELGRRTAKLQADMWSVARSEAVAAPSSNTQMVVLGVNDAINTQGYAQAAALNRIPHSAWLLLGTVALVANFLVGWGTRRPQIDVLLLLIFPLVVSMSFVLIADIDAPRGGLIRVVPQNLHITLDSMR